MNELLRRWGALSRRDLAITVAIGLAVWAIGLPANDWPANHSLRLAFGQLVIALERVLAWRLAIAAVEEPGHGPATAGRYAMACIGAALAVGVGNLVLSPARLVYLASTVPVALDFYQGFFPTLFLGLLFTLIHVAFRRATEASRALAAAERARSEEAIELAQARLEGFTKRVDVRAVVDRIGAIEREYDRDRARADDDVDRLVAELRIALLHPPTADVGR